MIESDFTVNSKEKELNNATRALWRAMERIKQLEDENAKLRKIVDSLIDLPDAMPFWIRKEYNKLKATKDN